MNNTYKELWYDLRGMFIKLYENSQKEEFSPNPGLYAKLVEIMDDNEKFAIEHEVGDEV
jgi:hypothetical protein